jgi:hypothetical protein
MDGADLTGGESVFGSASIHAGFHRDALTSTIPTTFRPPAKSGKSATAKPTGPRADQASSVRNAQHALKKASMMLGRNLLEKEVNH